MQIVKDILEWIDKNEEWYKISSLCREAGIDKGNFCNFRKKGELPEKYINPIIKAIQPHGFKGGESCFIYALKNSINNQIFYIGCSPTPNLRFREHIYNTKRQMETDNLENCRNCRKAIAEILLSDGEIIQEILEEIPYGSTRKFDLQRENYWILFIEKTTGISLTNMTNRKDKSKNVTEPTKEDQGEGKKEKVDNVEGKEEKPKETPQNGLIEQYKKELLIPSLGSVRKKWLESKISELKKNL